MKFKKIALAGLISALVAAPAFSDGHLTEEDLTKAMKARQAHMQLYAFNLGILGGMAQGEVEYNADVAQAAADRLAALATMNQGAYWLPGSDSDSLEGSRALPAIWEPGSKAGEIGAGMAEGALAMQAAASTGVEGIQANMRAVGGACGACHEDYRKPR